MGSSLFVDEVFGGLRAPNYFNGRLLTAEDLKADQDATLARLGLLGQGVGYGIIDGLIVTQLTNSSVRVTLGVGLNRYGQLLRLPTNVSLSLAPKQEDFTPTGGDGRFADCTFQGPGGSNSVPGGAYLLAVTPASRLEDSAPLKAAAGNVGTPACAGKWEVEGLQFQAIPLSGFRANDSGVTNDNRQNLLAHWCFGSLNLKSLPVDPFSFTEGYGGLDMLDPSTFTPCHLPLAVFYWTGSEISFLDAWSARRRLIQPYALQSWTGLLGDKRVADGQARFLQFQDQLDWLLRQGKGSGMEAEQFFRFLPPAGFLPVRFDLIFNKLRQSVKPTDTNVRAEARTQPDAEKQRFFQTRKQFKQDESARTTTLLASSANEGITADPRVVELSRYALALSERLDEVQRQIDELQEQIFEATTGDPNTSPPEETGGSRIFLRRSNAQKRARNLQKRQETLRLAQEIIFNADSDAPGVDPTRFFGKFPLSRLGIVDGETVDFTLQRSWYDEAIDLWAQDQEREAAGIDLYLVAGESHIERRPYVMFVKTMRAVRWLPLRKSNPG